MRDNTLIVFHSDNGGTRSKMFAGEGAVTGDLPPTTAPIATARARSTRAARGSWRSPTGRASIKPGNGRRHDPRRRHVPDAGRPGRREHRQGQAARRHRRLADDRATAQPSPRTEVVYNVEPFRRAVRQGDWKLHLACRLPPEGRALQPRQGPGPRRPTSRARTRTKTAGLQRRITDLASTMAPPLFFGAALHAALSAPLATPSEEVYFLGDEND